MHHVMKSKIEQCLEKIVFHTAKESSELFRRNFRKENYFTP